MKAAIIAAGFILVFSIFAHADPEIRLEPDTVKIGIIPQMSRFYFTAKAYSIGTDTLRIDTIEVFNECIQVKLDKHRIPPGDRMQPLPLQRHHPIFRPIKSHSTDFSPMAAPLQITLA